MKGKKIVSIIIVLLILLLIAGGAFAYAYIATDIFKTDKEMFFKYFSQITAEDGFIEKGIVDFEKKKMQTAFENSGEITVDVKYPDEDMDDIIEKVNELSIKFSGKMDSTNQKAEQNIKVDYGNDVVLPINYRQDGNEFGLQIDKLSKKFIAIRNENLRDLIDEISGNSSMSSRIDGIVEIFTASSDLISGIEFSDDEKKQLEQIYSPILQEALIEEKFTSTKTEQNKSYTLEISFQEIKEIIIKMLEKTKENTLIIDKLNESGLKMDPNMEPMDTRDIDEIIKSFSEDDVSQISNLKITLVQSDEQLNKVIVENEVSKILIEKNKTVDVLTYNINLEQNETEEQNESSIIMEKAPSSQKINMYFSVQYSGLESLTNVQENFKVGYSVVADNETMAYEYKIDTNTEFVDSVEISAIDKTNAVILNDYEESQITGFLEQVVSKLLDINKNQMEELGLKEYENPILYTNPITMLVVSFNNMASDVVGGESNTNLTETEKTYFNATFSRYEDIHASGSEVNAMIRTVYNNNSVSPQIESIRRIVKITLDGSEISVNIKTTVDVTKSYTVKTIYDEEGLVSEMRVTTNN